MINEFNHFQTGRRRSTDKYCSNRKQFSYLPSASEVVWAPAYSDHQLQRRQQRRQVTLPPLPQQASATEATAFCRKEIAAVITVAAAAAAAAAPAYSMTSRAAAAAAADAAASVVSWSVATAASKRTDSGCRGEHCLIAAGHMTTDTRSCSTETA